MNYKRGFWVLAGVLILGSLSIVVGLHTVYNQTPLNILYRAIPSLDPRADHYAWLPDHYTADLEILPHSYSRNVVTLDDFYEWKDRPDGVLAEYWDRTNVHEVTEQAAELMESKTTSGYTLNKFAMPAFFDPEVITFYELLPSTDASTYNAVLVIPGSGHQGALDVLGEPGPWRGYYYQGGIAKILVEEGYATYVVELRGYSERTIDVGMACNTRGDPTTCASHAVQHKMRSFGIDMNDLRTDEITQVLAYVESRPYIDRIAVAGISLGGGLATDQAIINGDVVDATIIASGIVTTFNSPLNIESGPVYGQSLCCDTLDYIATVAPKPIYVSYGKQEATLFRWHAESGFAEEFLAGVYALHEEPDSFYYIAHDGEHEYHMPSVLDFLDKHIGTAAEGG